MCLLSSIFHQIIESIVINICECPFTVNHPQILRIDHTYVYIYICVCVYYPYKRVRLTEAMKVK